jgi:hypothetical protein
MPDRYAPDRPFPSYAFLPGRDPHPTRDPRGHSHAAEGEAPARYVAPEAWRTNEDYLFGADLYNHGYLWEAHEAWEGLWHQAKHDGVQADFLQGLIQCAAACLKIPMGQPVGLARLADMGLARLERVRAAVGPHYMGLDLDAFGDDMRAFAASDPESPDERPRLELDD